MPKTNRTSVAGTTIRFFAERKDAIGIANAHTKVFQQQHHAVYAKDHGWLVENAVSKALYDSDGKLPDTVTNALVLRR